MSDRKKKDQKSQKGRPRSAGKRASRFGLFFAKTVERKLRRVLKHNGPVTARAYCGDSESVAFLRRISKEGTFAGKVAREALSLKA